ncbi:hydroxyacylglutathione hydrolase [Massilia sp. PAMC28688]|uniref:hydroxyacylglutathione hydrolase n=1 Tax=Massilia sp. PAMC28688 TaxID=2861283 RepID=UPI001C628B85|nr:hydroxyacylglutathione hydrolase [Massilia sp. PAMC28688]QYF93217.1 hydroxyacylglutathione hydrolase [Massilia sp. PAMC28688]
MPNQSHAALSILAVPAFKDNYLWLVHDGQHAAVVDPGDAAPILAALEHHHLTLTAILLTHHHADHIGGVKALLELADVPVFGPAHDGIEAVTIPLAQGDLLAVPGLRLQLQVMDVPGHTLGHIAYAGDLGGESVLFCGDTLFGAGCGRLFEGSPAQMAESLDKLAALPESTRVYCAHEYTLSNLRFAAAVEPGNEAIAERTRRDAASRARGEATIPSTIGLEKATNPFLRYREPAIAHQLAQAGMVGPQAAPLEVFTALREWKNTF